MKLGTAATSNSGTRRAIGVALILILLLLVGLLYSPWHRHNAAARQACIFSPPEGSPSLVAHLHIPVEPVLGVVWLAFSEARISPQQPCFEHRFQRAPPA